MEFGLRKETLDRIINVFSSVELVDQVILYGSRAKGTQREGSDIDITLVGLNLDHMQLHRFTQSLDELNLPYLFDVSIYHHIENEDLKEHIQRVGHILYSKQE